MTTREGSTWREGRVVVPASEVGSRSALLVAIGRALELLADNAFAEHLESVEWDRVEVGAQRQGGQLRVTASGWCRATGLHQVWAVPLYLDSDTIDDPAESYIPYLDHDEAMANWVEGDRMWTRIQGRWTEVER